MSLICWNRKDALDVVSKVSGEEEVEAVEVEAAVVDKVVVLQFT